MNFQQMIFDIIQIVYATTIPIFIAWIGNKIKRWESQKDIGKDADMLILRLILIDMHDKYVERGYISRNGFQTFNEIWDLYHNGYNGNTLTDKFHDEILELEIR